MFKPIVIKEKINPDGLVNTETGEVLEAKECSLELTKVTETDCFLVHSDNYIILDVTALELIKPLISYSDFGALLYIGRMVTKNYNVCMKDYDNPHTTKTISEELNITLRGASKILSKLVSKNILAYAICYPSGYKQKLYMINPSLLRQGKKYNNCILPMFKDLSIKKNVDEIKNQTLNQ